MRREKDKALASRSKEPQEKVCGRQTGEEIDARNDSEADGNLPTRVGKVGATGGGDKTNGTFVFGSGTSPFSLSGTFGVTDAYVGSIEDAGSMPNRDEVTTLGGSCGFFFVECGMLVAFLARPFFGTEAVVHAARIAL